VGFNSSLKVKAVASRSDIAVVDKGGKKKKAPTRGIERSAIEAQRKTAVQSGARAALKRQIDDDGNGDT
jgi:hypothetical protein